MNDRPTEHRPSGQAANDQLEAFAKHPAHALLISGPADSAIQAADDLIGRLLPGDRAHMRTVAPGDDKAAPGGITIGQIRELIAFFRLKVPGAAAIRRAAILRNADAMGTEAQNALLKLLEEPPADSVLILASAQPQSLLPTIRSRVQHIHLNGAAAKPDSGAVQLVKQALAGTTYDRLLLIDGLLKPKETAAAFVNTLATVAAASLEVAARKSADGNAAGTSSAHTTGVVRWQSVLRAAHTAQEALAQNANAKLTLTELMLAL